MERSRIYNFRISVCEMASWNLGLDSQLHLYPFGLLSLGFVPRIFVLLVYSFTSMKLFQKNKIFLPFVTK